MDTEDLPADPEGDWIPVASWIGTGALGVTGLGAVVWEPLIWLAVPVAVLLFVVGMLAFLSSYATSVARSRTDELSVASIYFLTTCAPPRIRRSLMASFVAQVALALLAASLRPYTSVAFVILAPLYGLGMAGIWGARYGTFPPRRERRTKKRTR